MSFVSWLPKIGPKVDQRFHIVGMTAIPIPSMGQLYGAWSSTIYSFQSANPLSFFRRMLDMLVPRKKRTNTSVLFFSRDLTLTASSKSKKSQGHGAGEGHQWGSALCVVVLVEPLCLAGHGSCAGLGGSALGVVWGGRLGTSGISRTMRKNQRFTSIYALYIYIHIKYNILVWFTWMIFLNNDCSAEEH